MEDHYRDSFEQMLKETADRFSMQPTRHVWFSLYNNLHPSRKWPSPGSWLLIAFFIVLLDFPNAYQRPAEKDKTALSGFVKASEKNHPSDREINGPGNNMSVSTQNADKRHVLIRQSRLTVRKPAGDKMEAESASGPAFKTPFEVTGERTQLLLALKQTRGQKKYEGFRTGEIRPLPAPDFQNSSLSQDQKKEGPRKPHSQTLPSEENKPGKFGYEIYATPSVGFRDVSRNKFSDRKGNTDAGQNPSLPEDQMSACIPAFNFEAGGSISFAFSEIMRVKAGVQLNYSKYNIGSGNSNQVSDAFFPVNDLNGEITGLKTRMSESMNGYGSDNRILSNQSYQVSLPLGADVKIADAENIEWFAGASVQPTFILPGSNLLLKNEDDYFPDEGYIRNWNINGGIETFISYHAGKGIRLNAGPQLRYQILSTYKNQFTVNERLYNLGIKIGISSRF